MQTNRWLRFFRPHAAGLTVMITWLGLMLAYETNVWMYVLFGVMATAYHIAGFAQNNVYDYKFDNKDPKKKHFPLVTGEIPYWTGYRVSWSLMICVLLFGLKISLLTNPLAYPWLLLTFGAGLFYNMKGKRNVFGNIGEALGFSPLMVWAYLCVVHTYEPYIAVAFAVTTLAILKQNFVEGDLKDVGNDETTLAYQLGVRQTKNGIVNTNVICWIADAFILAVIFGALLISTEYGFGIVLIGLFAIVTNDVMVSYDDHFWPKLRMEVRMKLFVIHAFVLLWTMLFAVAGRTGSLVPVTVGFVYVVIWAVVCNRLAWGTTIEPKV